MTITTERNTAVVRFHTAPTPVRAAFRMLEHLAPWAGARWAEHIWFRLPARGAPKRPAPPVGRPFHVTLDGRAVRGMVWGRGGPTVYLVHGWAGRREDLHAFVSPLVARGRRVVAFDAPSHGTSAAGAFGPRASSLPEFVAALTAVVAEFGTPDALVAHSLGATAVVAALTDGLPARRVALLAPMASAAGYARRFATLLGCGDRTHRRLVRRVERRIGAPLHHFDVPELARAIALPPAVIVHDRGDRSIPVSDGSDVCAAWPGARMRTTDGLGHRRLLADPDVVAHVVEFLVE
jgi:pimeloyl-ACP methyl ester carboxylesterase